MIRSVVSIIWLFVFGLTLCSSRTRRLVTTSALSQLVTEWFGDMMGARVEAKDVFIAFTVDQGGNVVNAIHSLNVPVVLCYAHRLNTVVIWMLGIGGSATTGKNPAMESLIKKLAACVGKFSHSCSNNTELKVFQELNAEFSHDYELIRRNDTR